MQERPSSFWQRLVGFADRITSPTGERRSDRRHWDRHAATLDTTCQSVNAPNAAPEPARICNISQGGLSLRVRRRFSPGELFRMNLPAVDGRASQTVLACVVYAAALADGDWAIGCTFTRELSNDDLQAFGARSEVPAWADERSYVRFQCATQANYVAASAELPVPRSARVLNIAPTGIGLLVDQPIKAGTLLNIDLPASGGNPPLTIIATVVHATSHSNGQWAVGCTFIRELTPRELGGLL